MAKALSTRESQARMSGDKSKRFGELVARQRGRYGIEEAGTILSADDENVVRA